MKQIVLLCKAYIDGVSIFSKGRREQMRSGQQKWIVPIATIGLGMAFLSFGSLLVLNYRNVYQLGAAFGHPDFLIYMVMMLSWIMILVLSFTSAISILFKSSDSTLLMTLPVKTTSIVWSKIVMLYATMLPLNLFLVLPGLIIFGIRYGFTINLLISSPFLLFAGPIVPIVISTTAASLIVRTSSHSKHKTTFEVIGMIILLGFIIAFQTFLTRFSTETITESSAIYQFFADRIEQFYSDFPPFAWAAGSVLSGGWLNLLKFILLSGFIGVVLGWITSRKYLVMLYASQASSSESVKKSKLFGKLSGAGQGEKPRSASAALVRREWMIIKSSSAFLLQTSMELLIIPLMLGVMALTGSLGDVKGVLDFIYSVDYIELIIFGILLLFFLISSISATSVSREGKTIAISRIIPLPPGMMAWAKVRFHLTIGYIAYLVYLTAAYVFFKLEPLHLLYMIPGGLVCLSLSSVIGLIIDLKRPMLTWNHPQQAMKQNLNVLISIGLNALMIGILAGIGFLLLTVGINTLVIGLIILIAASAGLVLLRGRMVQAAQSCYGPQI
ncbi:MAG: hypothetical protein HQ557_04100 [Bacteroidetes bacterium]|nr:hypothetical protein [Bacteroidota bacterium]